MNVLDQYKGKNGLVHKRGLLVAEINELILEHDSLVQNHLFGEPALGCSRCQLIYDRLTLLRRIVLRLKQDYQVASVTIIERLQNVVARQFASSADVG